MNSRFESGPNFTTRRHPHPRGASDLPRTELHTLPATHAPQLCRLFLPPSADSAPVRIPSLRIRQLADLLRQRPFRILLQQRAALRELKVCKLRKKRSGLREARSGGTAAMRGGRLRGDLTARRVRRSRPGSRNQNGLCTGRGASPLDSRQGGAHVEPGRHGAPDEAIVELSPGLGGGVALRGVGPEPPPSGDDVLRAPGAGACDRGGRQRLPRDAGEPGDRGGGESSARANE